MPNIESAEEKFGSYVLVVLSTINKSEEERTSAATLIDRDIKKLEDKLQQMQAARRAILAGTIN